LTRRAATLGLLLMGGLGAAGGCPSNGGLYSSEGPTESPPDDTWLHGSVQHQHLGTATAEFANIENATFGTYTTVTIVAKALDDERYGPPDIHAVQLCTNTLDGSLQSVGSSSLSLSMVDYSDGPDYPHGVRGPGVYTIYERVQHKDAHIAGGGWRTTDSSCQSTIHWIVSGHVVITSIASDRLTGHFAVTLDEGDHLSGKFDAARVEAPPSPATSQPTHPSPPDTDYTMPLPKQRW
jgi:hypothetical protein